MFIFVLDINISETKKGSIVVRNLPPRNDKKDKPKAKLVENIIESESYEVSWIIERQIIMIKIAILYNPRPLKAIPWLALNKYSYCLIPKNSIKSKIKKLKPIPPNKKVIFTI